MVPGGTANDFARATGLPLDPVAAAELAVDGTALRRFELGRLGDGHPFVNVASAGLASAAARRAAPLKPRLGALAYGVGAVRAAATASPLRCAVRAGGATVFEGGAWQVIVAVTGAFGGGSGVGAADPADGVLDVAILPAGSRIGLARRAWGLRRGTIAEQRGVEHHRGGVIEVDVPPGTEFNADGELRRDGLERVTVEPRCLRAGRRRLSGARAAATTRSPPAPRRKRWVPAMMRSMSARSSTSLRSSAVAISSSLSRCSAISRPAARLASSARCCCSSSRSSRVRSDTSPPWAEILRDVIDVPIAYSWIIAREISATRCRSFDAPVVTAPNTSSSATRPPSSTVM